MKKNLKTYISLILIVISAAAIIVFDVCNFVYTDDDILNSLLDGIIPRLIAGGALIGVSILLDYKQSLTPSLKQLPFHLLWCIPCFLVVFANFPFTALITASAQILRSDLIALFLLKCLSIGLMEEVLFRGLFQQTIAQTFENKPHGQFFTVLITSAVFGLIHFFNLFAGAGVGDTFLQVGYSFLIGAMLSAVIIKTNNLWLCVLLHTIFDVGGNIITDLGKGHFQDTGFWIFTAVAGIICLIHILYFLIEQDRKTDVNKNE